MFGCMDGIVGPHTSRTELFQFSTDFQNKDTTEMSWFKVSRFCYTLMKYFCDRRPGTRTAPPQAHVSPPPRLEPPCSWYAAVSPVFLR